MLTHGLNPLAVAVLMARRTASPWTPARLFTSEQGGWWDASDTSILFQDIAGSSPVTGSGDAVGRWLDKSGRANHLTQGVSASRFVLNVTSGLYSMVTDGLDDFMSVAMNLSGVAQATLIVGWRQDVAVQGSLVELSATPTTTAGAFRTGSTTGGSFYTGLRGDSADNVRIYNPSALPATRVNTTLLDLSAAAGADEIIQRVNGVVAAPSSVVSAGPAGGGNLANSTLYVGRRGGTSSQLNGRIYQIILIGRLLTAPELALTEAYVALKSGVAL